MRAERHQAALVPILDRGLIRRLGGEAAVRVIDIVGPHEGGPLTGLVVNLVRETQGSRATRPGKLSGYQALLGA